MYNTWKHEIKYTRKTSPHVGHRKIYRSVLCIFLHDQYLINNHGVFMQVRIQLMRKAAPPVTHPSRSTLVTNEQTDVLVCYSPLGQADSEGNASTRRLAS